MGHGYDNPKKKPPKGPLTEVRCLGPGKPEHTFQTDDPRGHRICQRCRDKVAGIRLSMRDEPVADPTGEMKKYYLE